MELQLEALSLPVGSNFQELTGPVDLGSRPAWQAVCLKGDDHGVGGRMSDTHVAQSHG